MTTTTSNAFTSPFKITNKISLPPGHWLIFCDKKVAAQLPKKITGKNFKILPVQGGEDIKSFETMGKLFQKIFVLDSQQKITGFCVVGGGSVGDAGAFAASVFKRGVRLLQVPTTYLSVVDSAFGGKTALNFYQAKNQIGTFYPAEKVFLIPSLLPCAPAKVQDAFAEILKTAILERKVWDKVKKFKGPSVQNFWKVAPSVIKTKLDIVKRDPFEKKGTRKLLNLGHSLGHLFEKLCSFSHGEAVALGLCFELEFFLTAQKLKTEDYLEIMEVWERFFDFKKLKRKLGVYSTLKAKKILTQDKKMIGKDFISTAVVYRAGKVKVEKIAVADLLRFLKTQGVLK